MATFLNGSIVNIIFTYSFLDHRSLLTHTNLRHITPVCSSYTCFIIHQNISSFVENWKFYTHYVGKSCISYILLDLFYHEQNRFQGHRKILGFSFFYYFMSKYICIVFFVKKGFGNYLSFFLSQIMVLFEPR